MTNQPSESRRSPRGAVSARQLAAQVVVRVLTDEAFTSEVLDAELAGAELSERDRALATELAYGVLRLERALAARLLALAPRGLAKGDPWVRAHLLVAAYQLLVLDRIPAFAAINEAVGALRERRGARVAGFANALLRRLSRGGARLPLEQGLVESVEPWLFDELCRAVGRDAALGLLGVPSAGVAPRRGLCVRLTRRASEPPAWARDAEPGRVLPEALWLPPSGDLRRLPGYAEGQFVVQEEGAQWAARAVGARPGERVLDACAGHGQKSSLLAEQLGPEGRLWVNDISPGKLERLRREFRRLGLPDPVCHQVDFAAGTGDVPGDMDRVLVDAPCTGTGTLRRLTPEDPRRLAEQALALLGHAASRARPGGRVFFVVCSVLRSECEDVVARAPAWLRPAPFDAPEARRITGDATEYRLLPHLHGTDGYYVASFVREPGG